jgi:hypothetical protein
MQLIAESLHNVEELVDKKCNPVDEDTAVEYFTPRLRPEQLSKK